MSWRGWQIGLVVAALGAASRPAGAQLPSSGPTRAAELLRAAAGAVAAKKWEACIAALSEAASLEDTPKTLGDLGLCEEQAGRFVEAFGHLARAMEAAPTQPKKEPWTRYQAALARVMERVVLVTVSASPPEAKIILDGRPLGAADGRVFAVEPGKHTIGARLAGYEDKVEPARDMRAGDAPSFHFQLVAKASPPPALPSSAPSALPSSSVSTRPVTKPPPLVEATPWYRPTWAPRGVIVALGWAGAATVLVSGQVTLALELDRESLQRGLAADACLGSSSARCVALHDRAMQRNVAGDVFIGATIATGVLGAATVIASILERGPVRPLVGVQMGPSAGGIAIRGAW